MPEVLKYNRNVMFALIETEKKTADEDLNDVRMPIKPLHRINCQQKFQVVKNKENG